MGCFTIMLNAVYRREHGIHAVDTNANQMQNQDLFCLYFWCLVILGQDHVIFKKEITHSY